MEMALAVASPDLRAHYGPQTRAFSLSKDSQVRTLAALDRARGIEKGWQRASVAVRNLLIRDALRLLEPASSEPPAGSEGAEEAWSFTDLQVLDDHLQRLSEGANGAAKDDPSEAVRRLLGDLISRAKTDTFPDFSTFARSQAGFQAGAPGLAADDDALLRYENWVHRYRPYLVLGVPLTDAQRVDEAEHILGERMAFFLAKNPSPLHTEHYTDRLWTFVYDVRDALRRADT
jgi:hypothetical protein